MKLEISNEKDSPNEWSHFYITKNNSKTIFFQAKDYEQGEIFSEIQLRVNLYEELIHLLKECYNDAIEELHPNTSKRIRELIYNNTQDKEAKD